MEAFTNPVRQWDRLGNMLPGTIMMMIIIINIAG